MIAPRYPPMTQIDRLDRQRLGEGIKPFKTPQPEHDK